MNMSSANSGNAPFPLAMPHEEEPDQVSESEPKEESEEELVGDAEGANSDTDLGETVPYSITHGEDTSSEEVRPSTPSPPRLPSPAQLRNDWVNFMGFVRRRTARKTVLPPKKRALSSTDVEPLPKRHYLLNQLEIGESYHQHEVIAAGQRDERADERLDSFAALTIFNTMMLAFVLPRGCFT
ncbi:hypothetical protein L1987_45692 [Smallanthus sonchifolius]|uniref:Uncharacterized protein n=1 Tax=Smallanthus sonchifolius TaxID=185202 RepID=A0ACB9FZD3_9ASTR|nr:hypothetical protein L1987_45692 [Smallanthus sonchifolius]